ncbi:MAG: RNA degradosome polyphosphate kinase, partial [Acidobacteria bacterium]|nr:RNA degradosome polyphosphate kinase [Acidobacteriota bacterium]
VHVVYGIVGLKTHCKVCLVVREEAGEMRRYVHLASGNYNGKTARVYEDFGILTCNDEVAKDVGELFNYLTGFSKGGEYRRIVVSPAQVRDRVVELIGAQAERGARGRILVKVNGLTDPTVIDALYEASRAGVEIRLIVRTLCCLRPGIEGLSENITVHSVVGEFLEHSRLFIFSRPGEPDFEVYLGSADLMERNLDRRVEAIVPIENPSMRADLLEAFDITWSDDVFTWILGSDRRWRRLQSVNGVVAQSELKSRALERARRAES